MPVEVLRVKWPEVLNYEIQVACGSHKTVLNGSHFSCFLWQDTFTEDHRLLVNTSGIDQLFIHSNH